MGMARKRFVSSGLAIGLALASLAAPTPGLAVTGVATQGGATSGPAAALVASSSVVQVANSTTTTSGFRVIPTEDVTGDGRSDLVVIDASNRMHIFPGDGTGKLGTRYTLGGGWNNRSVYAPGDFNSDGKNDLVAIDSKGLLWLYPGNGDFGFGAAKQIGHGWSSYRMIPVGDLNMDGHLDMLGIDSAGLLWFYAGKGNAKFAKAVQVGHGWKGYDLYAAGDATGDGRPDILSIDKNGVLWLYEGRGTGTFKKAIRAGQGWKGVSLSAGADLNGDGRSDVVSLWANGDIKFHAAKGGGQFRASTLMGSGFTGTLPTTPNIKQNPGGGGAISTATKFYVDKTSRAWEEWSKASGSNKAKLGKIANTPQGIWLVGNNNTGLGTVTDTVRSHVNLAKQAGTVPVFVVYSIPGRDCQGGHSAGGLNASSYKTWIDQIATGLNGSGAWVILEPDAFPDYAQANCGGQERVDLINYASSKLSAAGARTYLDVGHSNWVSEQDTAAAAAKFKFGAGGLTGIAINTSNYQSNAKSKEWAEDVLARMNKPGATFVIDSSRNGVHRDSKTSGDNYWCNPTGAKLGRAPEVVSGKEGRLDAYLWIKRPGESDGHCNGAPGAGEWWQQGALDLAS